MEERISRLQQNLPDNLDGVIITGDVNRRYYLGMASTAGTLLVTRKEAVLFIDFRYYEAACRTVTGCRVVRQEKLMDQLNQVIREEKLETLGVESGYMTLSEACRLRESLTCKVDFGNEVNGVILRQRSVKSPRELELITQAQSISDQAFLRMLEIIRPGMTEKEIALELEITCRRLGSEDKSFDPIVVGGPNSSCPHGHPGDRPVARGDFITMDFGAVVEGYHADMTRTIALGEPTDEMRQVYAIVREAKEAASTAIRAGIPGGQVDKVARDLIAQRGYGDCFGHGLGHGVGLEIHEEPRFSPGAKEPVEEGAVISVEPGIYLAGRFGVRIEDLVEVTAQGFRSLNNTTTDLIIL